MTLVMTMYVYYIGIHNVPPTDLGDPNPFRDHKRPRRIWTQRRDENTPVGYLCAYWYGQIIIE